MTKLVIALATRGRPALLLDTLARTLPHISEPSTMLIVMVDADDHPTIQALETLDRSRTGGAGRLIVNVREREDTVAEKFNRALSEPADVYLAMVDHSPHLTPGFDRIIRDSASLFPDGIGVVYNRLANASFPSVNAVTRRWVDITGYIYPPYFPYWFIDHWLDDVARITGRIAFADVIVDSSKKQPTQEMREPAWWATFFDALYLMRRDEAHRIIDELDAEPQWRKQVLRTHHPLIEYRSRWVNESVRANDRALTGMEMRSLRDPRYVRVRTKAVNMLPELLDNMPAAPDYGQLFRGGLEYRALLLPPTNIANIKQAYA